MEQNTVSLILQLKEQMRREKEDYIQAIAEGNEAHAKEIARKITHLQSEIKKLLPSERPGYQGF